MTAISNLLSSQESISSPNIVWLVSEDNSKHYLRLYDSAGAEMPAVESLAKEGVTFNHAFSNAPVCSVSRSTIISGCYAPRIGAQYHRKMKLAEMPDQLEMFPFYLRQAGYYVTNSAKEDYNLVQSSDMWDESSRNASYKNRNQGQPFFHIQNFGVTHEGQLHFTEEEMRANPPQHSLETPLLECYPPSEIFKYSNAYYRDLHLTLDQQIQAFLKEMKKDGLMENTIIFYYGDHGGVLPGSKGYLYERGLHVPMVVYFPEKWKHLIPFEKGSRTDAFVQFIDLAPTLLKLAGLDIPDEMDGSAFLGEDIDQEFLANKNTAYGYADRFDEKYDLVRSVREKNYKYIRNYQPYNIDGLFNFYRYKMLAYQEWEELFKNDKLSEVQAQFFMPRKAEALYDLNTDPNETNNLIAEPAHQQIKIHLRNKLQQHLKSMPDLSFIPESILVDEALTNATKYGQKMNLEIHALIDIADLQLGAFKEAASSIEAALTSDNRLERYWGLIVCTTFGSEAEDLKPIIHGILKSDSFNLNRLRALEYLAMNGEEIDDEVVHKIVKSSHSETECNLILNTIALLETTLSSFDVSLSADLFQTEWIKKERQLISRRMVFINE